MQIINILVIFSLLIFNTKAYADIAVAGGFDPSYFVRGTSSDISGAQGIASTQHTRHFKLEEDSVIGRVQWVGSQIPEHQFLAPIFQINFYHSTDDPNFNLVGKRPQVPAFASFLVEPEHSFLERGQSNFMGILGESLALPKGDYWLSISFYAPNINDANYIWLWSKGEGYGASARFNISNQQIIISSSSNSIFTLWGEQPNNPSLDSDNDGVNNHLNLCPNTVDLNEIDEDGCSDTQKDSDNDGVSNDIDECPDSLVSTISSLRGVNSVGCTMLQLVSRDGLKVISTSGDSPVSRGGEISDVSGEAPSKAFEDLFVGHNNIARISKVAWRGMSMPEEYKDAYPIFEISFHRAKRDRNFPYGHKPVIEPFASYTIEGEIFTKGVGSDGNQSIYFTNLPETVELDSSNDYWLSISLAAPNLNNSGLQWYWGRASGLLYSTRLDVTTGELSIVSQTSVYRLYGNYINE